MKKGRETNGRGAGERSRAARHRAAVPRFYGFFYSSSEAGGTRSRGAAAPLFGDRAQREGSRTTHGTGPKTTLRPTQRGLWRHKRQQLAARAREPYGSPAAESLKTTPPGMPRAAEWLTTSPCAPAIQLPARHERNLPRCPSWRRHRVPPAGARGRPPSPQRSPMLRSTAPGRPCWRLHCGAAPHRSSPPDTDPATQQLLPPGSNMVPGGPRDRGHCPLGDFPQDHGLQPQLGHGSAPPLAWRPVATALKAGAVAISPAARTGGSPGPGPRLDPGRNRGPSPQPHSPSPSPLASGAAPRPVQTKHKRSRQGKRDRRSLLSHAPSQSREPLCSGARGPRCSLCPSDTSALLPAAAPVAPAGNSRSVGSRSDALLGRGCQK